jgi:ubiquinone/menaquinone biosynthesis C-methylase UbiE
MVDNDAERGQVAASAAEIYERFFVPALFGQWATVMVDAAGVGPGDRVLDVGCGTGVVARAAAERVETSGSVTGLDLNDGMLAVAAASHPDITWRQGPAEHLPFDDGAFDRVVSQFMLMFLEEPDQALSEMRRVLAPSGSVALATWASVEESPGYAAMVELLEREIGGWAADALRAPFTIGSAEQLRSLVAPTFPGVHVEQHAGTAHFESIEAWVHTDVRGWTLADAITDEQQQRILAAARVDFAPFTDPTGRVAFPAPALVASARI